MTAREIVDTGDERQPYTDDVRDATNRVVAAVERIADGEDRLAEIYT
ncbi:hypothetical protein AB0J82_22520 [Asanoa sp. NPDC049518]